MQSLEIRWHLRKTKNPNCNLMISKSLTHESGF
ncbi:MAG: hypothetical protein ACD_2C00252G0003, partial [uncultured bacterium (gcode 4)]